MDEKEIIKKAQKGDSAAFETLVRTYQGKVYALCLSMMKHSQDAEDAAQEAFVKCYKSLASFRFDSAFYTWLCRLSMNVCLDALRAKKGDSDDIDAHFDLCDNKSNVEESVLLSERRRAVRDAIEKLPEDFRAPLVLRDMQSLSYGEVAAALNLSEGTVKSRIFRARDKLREILKENAELFGTGDV